MKMIEISVTEKTCFVPSSILADVNKCKKQLRFMISLHRLYLPVVAHE